MRITEKKLQIFWKKIKTGTILKTSDGKDIKILSPGNWNFEEGPDFQNAKFEIDGITDSGDVEIHLKSSDWFLHNHNNDSNYKNVKLHVVFKNDKTVMDKITIILPEKLSLPKTPVEKNLKFGSGKCQNYFSTLDEIILNDFLSEAGIERFKEKASAATAEIIKDGFDKAVLKKIFEAAGYKKNKENFVELFKRILCHPEYKNPEILPALIWGESGLLPDPTTKDVHREMKEYTSKLWNIWWKYRLHNEKPIKWIKAGVRPLNSPERRIAGLCSIISKTNAKILCEILKLMKNSQTPSIFSSKLIEFFTVKDEIWDNWTNFRNKRKLRASIIGKMRSIDIVTTVILPFLFAKFAIDKDQNIMDFCIETFRVSPLIQDNIKLKIAINKWFTPPSRGNYIITNAASAHGAIFLLEKFCYACSYHCNECMILSQLEKNRKNILHL
ncbi:MAG TPA: DUF2851 family protein [Victivallales bacterium]|nr:DUF2851 family protein [Victivallales bacterium]